jgi:hypothetical protein
MSALLYELVDEFDEWRRREEMRNEEANPMRPTWARGGVEGMRAFLDEAFDAEFERLRERTGEAPGPCEVLVLVAGMSPQPLLLSVAWHRPRRVVVVHSATMKSAAVELVNFLEAEGERLHPDKFEVEELIEIPDAEPVEAFARMRAELEHRGLLAGQCEGHGGVALDITGGKKTMVSAAFFLASEYGIPAVYVDGDYDETVRHPRPGTLAVKRLGNPAAALALRALRRVPGLFEQGAFAAARDVLDDVCRDLQQESEVLQGYAKLDQIRAQRDYAEGCVHWEAAEYGKAWTVMKGRSRLPRPVRDLGPKWKGLCRDGRMRDDPRSLFLHLVDAVRWAERRLDHLDPRLGYLRFFQIGELTMEGTLAALCNENRVSFDPGTSTSCGPRRSAFIKAFHGALPSALLLRDGRVERDQPMDDGEPFRLDLKFSHKPDANPCERCGRPREDRVRVVELRDACMPSAHYWLVRKHMQLRNDCAHRLAVVDTAADIRDDTTGVLPATKHLLLQASAVVGEVESGGRRVDLGALVRQWFDDPEFLPEGFDLKGQ